MKRFSFQCVLFLWPLLLSGSPHPCATPWLEADDLFQKDPNWVGGDDAYSVDLGNKRTLWLFADSLIDPSARHTRQGAKMIHNSLGIQTGYDPSNASISFYWGNDAEKQPSSYFPNHGDDFFWPGHGIRLGSTLTIFLMRVRKVNEGLGFNVCGWNAVKIDNPDDSPGSWRYVWLDSPANDMGIIVGSASVLRQGNFLYAFSARETVSSHPLYLARWPVDDVRRGELEKVTWWSGSVNEWAASPKQATPVFDNGQTELTVHFDDLSHKYVCVQTVGFGPASLALRVAEKMSGPWSLPETFYRPPECDQSNILIYAGKAHPQLKGADLVLTYATNSLKLQDLFLDNDIYFPRFLRVGW
jgi:hypothetical protein